MQSLKSKIEADLKKSIITSKVLLGNCRLLDEKSRMSSAFCDKTYLPFYYYLGKYIKPKNIAEIGFRLGLLGACFLKSCKSVEYYFAFQEKSDEFYSPRLGIGNVKDNYKKKLDFYYGKLNDLNDVKKHFDLIIINEESTYDKHLAYLDVFWDKLDLGGLIVVDYVDRHKNSKKAFYDFCKIKNREICVINSRYGVGIIER